MSRFPDPRKILKWGLATAAVLLIAVQLVPVDRSNPPVEAEIPASTAVSSILRRSCYDCHSNQTTWPWYSRVAPVSWLVARDVHEGRRHLNFSTWGHLAPAKQVEAIQEIWEEVSEGEMPLWIYVPLHPEARLSDGDKAALEAWAKSVAPMEAAQ